MTQGLNPNRPTSGEFSLKQQHDMGTYVSVKKVLGPLENTVWQTSPTASNGPYCEFQTINYRQDVDSQPIMSHAMAAVMTCDTLASVLRTVICIVTSLSAVAASLQRTSTS